MHRTFYPWRSKTLLGARKVPGYRRQAVLTKVSRLSPVSVDIFWDITLKRIRLFFHVLLDSSVIITL
jgi:hypothetical protein